MRKWFIVAALLFACGSDKPADKPADKPTTKAGATAAPDVQGRAIAIEVKRTGYTPAKVEVKAGEQVTLVFTRTEDGECNAEVAIPSLNVKKALPVGQAVAIPFKADQPGEVPFTCGMAMLQGTIVVQ